MTFESKQRIVPDHATAVIRDLNELLAPGLDLNSDSRGARVERIFEQFLHHGRGPFHHFAGCDFVSNVLWKDVDAAHASGISFASARSATACGSSSTTSSSWMAP